MAEQDTPDQAVDQAAIPAEPVAYPEPGPAPAAPAAAPVATGPHYLSVVAFTLGLVGIISPGLPSIAAIVLGHIGLAKEPSGRTFAIIGLVAGYVMVGLFVIGMIIFIAFWGIAMSSMAALFSEIPWDGMPGRVG